jgi:AraC family transcriptional regulator, arabinose operon regulatory protein
MIISTGRQHYPATHRYTRERGHQHWTLELTLSGTMLRRCGPLRRFRPQPNHTLLLTPPDTPYGLRGRTAGDEIWVLFQPRAALVPLLDWPRDPVFGLPALPLPCSAQAREIVAVFEEVHRHSQGAAPTDRLWAENALDRLLLLAAGLAAAQGASVGDDRIRSSIAYLEHAFRHRLTVPHLAGRAGLSVSRYAHLFRAQTGCSPMAYLERLRLDHACQLLLRTDLPMKAIADRVGLDDPSHFCTRFRHRYGRPPTAWRRQPTA